LPRRIAGGSADRCFVRLELIPLTDIYLNICMLVNMKLKNPNVNNFGFSLAEVMVAVGISGFLLLVVNQVLSDVNKWMADISVDSELVEISQLISARVNCEKTKDALGITANNPPAVTTQVQLYDKNSKAIFTDSSLGGIFSGYRKVSSDWLVEATWTGRSFSVRVGKMRPTADDWAKHPITKQPLDFSMPKHRIFGDLPNTPLCPKRSTGRVLATAIQTTSGVINGLLNLPNQGDHYDTNGVSRTPAQRVIACNAASIQAKAAPTGQGCYDATIMLMTPLLLSRGCHKFCRQPGNNFVSGTLIGLGDWPWILDASGNIKGQGSLYTPGNSVVICECYL